jgi:hypothetical protein
MFEDAGMGVNVLPLRTPKSEAHRNLGLCATLPLTTSTLPEELLQYTSESPAALGNPSAGSKDSRRGSLDIHEAEATASPAVAMAR